VCVYLHILTSSVGIPDSVCMFSSLWKNCIWN